MNKYRIESTRLQSWDYGSNSAYFITICTKNRKHFFGNILDGKMHLTEIGLLAEKYWFEIPQHFPFVSLGNFIVMPDHTHGILIINKLDMEETLHCNVSPVETPKPKLETDGQMGIEEMDNHLGIEEMDNYLDYEETLHCNVSTDRMAKISPKPGTISTIIRSYKSVVTINARKIQKNFGWQSLFHDFIIRNAQQYENINSYIAKNPAYWGKKR